MSSPAPSNSGGQSGLSPLAALQQVLAALQQVLAAEHAAVYAYSVIGVHLSDSAQIQSARTLQAVHRSERDAIAGDIASMGATPSPAAATYTPAEAVHNAESAQRWALQVEEQCGAAYRYLLAGTTDTSGDAGGDALPSGGNRPSATAAGLSSASITAYRRTGLNGLVSAAGNALGWRRLLTPATPTEPFPGL
jgi:hypothetical protein